MSLIIALLLNNLQPTPTEITRFQATDPQDLSLSSAEEHLLSARLAGLIYNIHPATLLAIAWHESRYHQNQVTHEPGPTGHGRLTRVSCGPMTPEPHYKPCTQNELSTLGGYLIGAQHLRFWLDHPRCHNNTWCGIISYAGGGGLVYACTHRKHSINAFHHDACRVAPDILARKRIITR